HSQLPNPARTGRAITAASCGPPSLVSTPSSRGSAMSSSYRRPATAPGGVTVARRMAPTLTAQEIREANERYHDVAADGYDSKWGIDFAETGARQVLSKLEKALGEPPGHFRRSLEIGAGTGYFSLNLAQS